MAPRSVGELLAIPTAESNLGERRQTLPKGTPVDAATAEEVTRTVRQLEACATADETLQFFALFSDDAITQMRFTEGEELRAAIGALESATPSPYPPGVSAVFAGPWRLERLADGRVLAAVTWLRDTSATCVEPNRIWVLIFEKQGGRWVVDEVVERVAEGEMIDLVGLPPRELNPTPNVVCSTDETRGAVPSIN